MSGKHWKTVCIKLVSACVMTGSKDGMSETRPFSASFKNPNIPDSNSGSIGPKASSKLMTIALASSTN